MKKAILVFAIIGIAFALSGRTAFAYQIESLANTPAMGDYVMGPGQTELQLNPGDKRIRYLTVTNRYGKDMNFMIGVEDFTGSKNINDNIVLL